MIAKLTTLSANSSYGNVIIPIEDSTEYIFNCEWIKDLTAHNTNDSKFTYSFNPQDRETDTCLFLVDETVSSIVTEADTIPYSSRVYFNVYEDGDTTATPVSHSFNVSDISFGVGLGSSNSVVFIATGGFALKKYIISHTLAEIITLVKTGS